MQRLRVDRQAPSGMRVGIGYALSSHLKLRNLQAGPNRSDFAAHRSLADPQSKNFSPVKSFLPDIFVSQ